MTAAEAPTEGGSRRRDAILVALGVIVLIALGVRIAALERPGRVISRDGIRYAKIARAFDEGRSAEALANDYAPGFPAAAALVGRAAGAADDRGYARAAALAAAIAGALSVVPAFALARRAAGARAGLLAAMALSVHPGHVAATSDALSEGLLLLGTLGSLALGFAAAEGSAPSEAEREPPGSTPLLAALAGLAAGVAYLARPEGILVALAPLALPGGRLRRAVATLAALALLAAPYAAMASANTGRLALSKKKDAAALVEGGLERPGSVLANAGRNLGRAVESGQAVAILGALGLAGALAARGAPRRLAATLGSTTLLLLGAQSLVRADPRFGLVLSVIVTPLAGVALGEIVRRVGGRLRRGDAPASAGLVPGAIAASLLGLAAAPGILRATRPERAHYLDCARAIDAACAAEGIAHPRIVAEDARIAHLAGDEEAIDAQGRDRAARGDLAPSDALVREEGAPAPAGLTLRPIGRFAPPPGSRLPALLADRILPP